MIRVALVGGCRTPFVKAGGVYSKFSLLDLGIHAVTSLVARLKLKPDDIDELSYSTVLLDPRLSNFAREIVLRSDLPKNLSAHSVTNNCISGLVAMNLIREGIVAGRIRSGIAGGAESMSCPALTWHPKAEALFLKLSRARTLGERLAAVLKYRPKYIFPVPPSPKEPSTGLTMGQHCELTAQEFAIPREIQDRIAFRSHNNAAKAQAADILNQEISPFAGVDKDNLIRGNTDLEKLAKLTPVFDRSDKGTLTAGNSSALTDGASAVCLMSEEEAKRQGREALAYVDGVEFSAIAPGEGLLMAPALALPRLMERFNLRVSDIDRFEIHEAFGAQVAANIEVWENGWSRYPSLKPIGKIPEEKINVNGGSIAIGHPFAATGGRLLTSLALEMKRKNLRTGVISVCAAGAMAGAVLLRR